MAHSNPSRPSLPRYGRYKTGYNVVGDDQGSRVVAGALGDFGDNDARTPPTAMTWCGAIRVRTRVRPSAFLAARPPC